MRRTVRIAMLCAVVAGAAIGAQAQGKGDQANQRLGPPVDGTTGGPFCSTTTIVIPDNDPGGVTDALVIAESFLITDLNVGVSVAHSWVGDLIFTLEHVDTGTTAVIIDRVGVPVVSTVGCGGDDILAEIDDEAALPVEDECADAVPTINGSFIGGDPANNSLLAAFAGEDINGTWTMTVSDNAGLDTGVMNEWCLVTTPVPVELMGFSVE